MASTAVIRVLLDVSDPAPNKLPDSAEISLGCRLYFGASLNRNFE